MPAKGQFKESTNDWRIDSRGYEIFGRSTRKRNPIPHHVVIVENILGKPLPEGAIVHHADENKLNNKPKNLVVCPGVAYHRLLHQRIEAKKACGNASFLKCKFCKRYDQSENIIYNSKGRSQFHRRCRNEYNRRWREANPNYKNEYDSRKRSRSRSLLSSRMKGYE